MTERPDTAAIRAMLWTGLDVETALELCDAVDQLRAERDRAHHRSAELTLLLEDAETRAEAASDCNCNDWFTCLGCQGSPGRSPRGPAAETDQPDTAKIRAMTTSWSMSWRHQALALCDALDAARAERDEVKGLLDDKSRRDDTALMAYKREKHRAEAAEARADELVRLQDRCEWAPADLHGLNFNLGWGTSGLSLLADRLEAAETNLGRWQDKASENLIRAKAAEARIAAALDVAGHDFYQSEAQRLARDVRRALTEGTGR